MSFELLCELADYFSGTSICVCIEESKIVRSQDYVRVQLRNNFQGTVLSTNVLVCFVFAHSQEGKHYSTCCNAPHKV